MSRRNADTTKTALVTLSGRLRCFDFLGNHISPAGLAVAKQTVANFIEKASRLYEQERRVASAASPLEM